VISDHAQETAPTTEEAHNLEIWLPDDIFALDIEPSLTPGTPVRALPTDQRASTDDVPQQTGSEADTAGRGAKESPSAVEIQFDFDPPATSRLAGTSSASPSPHDPASVPPDDDLEQHANVFALMRATAESTKAAASPPVAILTPEQTSSSDRGLATAPAAAEPMHGRADPLSRPGPMQSAPLTAQANRTTRHQNDEPLVTAREPRAPAVLAAKQPPAEKRSTGVTIEMLNSNAARPMTSTGDNRAARATNSPAAAIDPLAAIAALSDDEKVALFS
jgi:hypothetical protein